MSKIDTLDRRAKPRRAKPGSAARRRGLDAWSFSRLKLWRQCAAKLAFQVFDRLKPPESKAMKRGSKAHEDAERYVTAPSDASPAPRVPKIFSPLFSKGLKNLRAWHHDVKLHSGAEAGWAFNRRWQLVQNWYGRTVWVRVKVDFFALFPDKDTLLVVDYKTGKRRDAEHLEQLELYALAAFKRYKHFRYVQAEMWYLDAETTAEATLDAVFDREELEELERTWHERTETMLTDRVFAPRPSKLCEWCPYAAAKGGPCEHG